MKRYLFLENGLKFTGDGFGADKEVVAEIVFTTGLTGYLETLTDPSFTGQTVVFTFPLTGNYGVIPDDFESKTVGLAAYIAREYCDTPSNFRSQRSLDDFLKEIGITGLCHIDTRRLTRVLRENGIMNGIVTDNENFSDFELLKNFHIKNSVERVSVTEPEFLGSGGGQYKINMLDFGAKGNIAESLMKRGCDVTLYPYNTSAEDILATKPDGIFLTNGPGDPKDNVGVIETLKTLMASNVPMMGICLGHQLMALAQGFDTLKLKYGHRGANQPVKCENGRVYITSQNHGYAVDTDTIDPKIAVPFFTNANDGTNEGLFYKNFPAYSVQFHPEACGGPHDTDFLFDMFITMMKEAKDA